MKTLQNSLAHQRLSQSRTSLDDSEYSTRFNRLDGLVAQLALRQALDLRLACTHEHDRSTRATR